jgi:hypothetical protein
MSSTEYPRRGPEGNVSLPGPTPAGPGYTWVGYLGLREAKYFLLRPVLAPQEGCLGRHERDSHSLPYPLAGVTIAPAQLRKLLTANPGPTGGPEA